MDQDPKFIVMSGVGPEHPRDEPGNWAFTPCWSEEEVREEVIHAEGHGAETVKVFKLIKAPVPE